MNKKFIPVSEPFLRDTEREFLMDAFDSGWISASGPYNKKLEDEFSKFCVRLYEEMPRLLENMKKSSSFV